MIKGAGDHDNRDTRGGADEPTSTGYRQRPIEHTDETTPCGKSNVTRNKRSKLLKFTWEKVEQTLAGHNPRGRTDSLGWALQQHIGRHLHRKGLHDRTTGQRVATGTGDHISRDTRDGAEET